MTARVKVQLDSQLLKVAVVGVGIPGPKGEDGSGVGGAFTYTHTQAVAATTWVLNHNLGGRPNVSVYTAGGVEVWAEVVHISVNQAQVLLDTPLAGFALCT